MRDWRLRILTDGSDDSGGYRGASLE